MNVFVNGVTRAVFLKVVEDWADDPRGIAAEWLQMGNGSAGELLARQFQKDVSDEYAEVCNDDLATEFYRAALRRVSWEQVAERLLRTFGGQGEAQAHGEDAEAA
jgi:hypothetical protein